uniref:DRBM domain-containing protein n=1 Tax=Oryza meridionalis TaxID=40149 RepID=A0A0E0ETN4_9ORYZ
MYKNQLQELAQRSCFSLPSYVCTREGPDHAPRFKATVTFNGETFDGPSNCTTLRQAEHAAAEVALARLSLRGPSSSLTARVLDETGVYKNLLQETAHRAGLKLPVYTTVRSGPGHSPVFSSTVELAGMSFAGDPAKTKKHAEKNAAMAAWSSLKQMPEARKEHGCGGGGEEQEHVVVARVLAALKPRDDCGGGGEGKAAAQQRQQAAASGSRAAAAELEQERRKAAELVHMLHAVMLRDRAADAMPPPPPTPSPCYYAPYYHHGGVAPTRPFAGAAGFHAPPAVSVRSVIPVCAAPPSPRPPARKEDDPATSSKRV